MVCPRSSFTAFKSAPSFNKCVANECLNTCGLHFAFEDLSDLPILSREEMTTGYYLRVNAEDETGVLADVTTILSRAGISIDAIMQQTRLKDMIPIVILTDPIKESIMDEALAKIQALPAIHGEIVRIRLESLES